MPARSRPLLVLFCLVLSAGQALAFGRGPVPPLGPGARGPLSGAAASPRAGGLAFLSMGGEGATLPQAKGANSLPATFRALRAAGTGETFRSVAKIQEVPTQELAADEVYVKVAYCGINGGCETFRARGEGGFTGNQGRQDFALGAEGSGVVEATGSGVKGLQVGDSVAFVGSAFAEYTRVKEAACFKVREASADAVALRISGVSAFTAALKAELRQGETVLVTAAAGGLGHFVVQAAKKKGCTVIGTCRSNEKAQMLCKLGCDQIINYKNRDIKEAVLKQFPNGVDAVIEGVGGKTLETALDCLKPDGRLVMAGYISEYPHSKDEKATSLGFDQAEIFWKNKTIKRGQQTIHGNLGLDSMEAFMQARNDVFSLYDEGKLKVVIEPKQFSGLESIADALEYMLSGETMGKVVVKI